MQGGPGAGGKRKRETNEEIERVPWPCTVQFIARYLSHLLLCSLCSIIWCFFGRAGAGVAALCVSHVQMYTYRPARRPVYLYRSTSTYTRA